MSNPPADPIAVIRDLLQRHPLRAGGAGGIVTPAALVRHIQRHDRAYRETLAALDLREPPAGEGE